ncbi:MAG: hypothetical protein GY818_06975 [Planctomycetaceae bacterium]|nr:hypothetical protein [Planctomycetaceae bacterium]
MNNQNNMSFGNLSHVEAGDRPNYDELIPKGDQTLRAIEIQLQQCGPNAKDPNGQYIDAQFEVVDGPFANRRIFQKFNVININQEAVNIALGEIKQWIAATGEQAEGELTMSRILALEGRQFVGLIGVDKGRNNYPDKNKISQFKAPVNNNNYQQQQPQQMQNNQGYQQNNQMQQTSQGYQGNNQPNPNQQSQGVQVHHNHQGGQNNNNQGGRPSFAQNNN